MPPTRQTSSGIRHELVSRLMDRITKGDAIFSVESISSLFREAGLNPDRLTRALGLHRILQTLTRDRIEPLRYDAARDVRDSPVLPKDRPVLLITGDTGTGKSWQLAKLLGALADDHRPATLLAGARTVGEFRDGASSDIWNHGLGDTTPKPLEAMAAILADLVPGAPRPGVIIALDDVRDASLARDLVRQDWRRWNMALALTAPPEVARALANTDDSAIRIHPVDIFTVSELKDLFSVAGRPWLDPPPDLRELLRRPLLAGIYLQIPHDSFETTPSTEFEIFELFWKRIAAQGGVGDQGLVLALANRAAAGDQYPLPREDWSAIGMDDPAAARLAASGWIAVNGHGRVSFVHDRLLNWACAKSFAYEIRDGVAAPEELGDWLVTHREDAKFGYTALDLLWLLGSHPEDVACASGLVARLELGWERGGYSEILYRHLLPTLGARAVPILLARLDRLSTDPSPDYRVELVAAAFARLSEQPDVNPAAEADRLLASDASHHQDVALAILAAQPRARALDRLWAIHVPRHAALATREGHSVVAAYEASFAALVSCVALDPEWLHKHILATTQNDPASTSLAYLLNGLDHPEARAIWHATADHLIASLPPHRPRSLLLCIARFGDHDRLGFAVAHLRNEMDLASSMALTAIAVVEPNDAIARLGDVAEFDRYVSRDHWLPFLLREHAAAVRARILELAEAAAAPMSTIVDLFHRRANRIDAAILLFLLDLLDGFLSATPPEHTAAAPPLLQKVLDFLAGIRSPDLLAVLESRAGSTLERGLADAATSCLGADGHGATVVRESARHLLVLIGGHGIGTLIQRETESDDPRVRHRGLRWACGRSDARHTERLVALASRPAPTSGGEGSETPPPDFLLATRALAAAGTDDALLTALDTGAHLTSPTTFRGFDPITVRWRDI